MRYGIGSLLPNPPSRISAMFFRVLAHGIRTPFGAKSCAYLLVEHWDDWFRFETMYMLVVFDADGERHVVGEVKIGQFGMPVEQRRAAIPEDFEELDERFFSLGQDASYYEDLSSLGPVVRDR